MLHRAMPHSTELTLNHYEPFTDVVPRQPALLKAKLTDQPLTALNWLSHATAVGVK